jgi:hypothetical protein
MSTVMRIDCYISEKCTSEDGLRTNIARALELENMNANVNLMHIDDEKARSLGIKGSPSVFVNDIELQPLKTGEFS